MAALLAAVVLLVVLVKPGGGDLPQRRNQKDAYLNLLRLRRALEMYHDFCGGYPAGLDAIAPPAPLAPDCRRLGSFVEVVRDEQKQEATETNFGYDQSYATQFAGYLFVQLSDPGKSGYFITYRAADPLPPDSTTGLYRHYQLRADPVVRHGTGHRSFWLDDHTSLRWNDRGPAGPADPEPNIDPALDVH